MTLDLNTCAPAHVEHDFPWPMRPWSLLDPEDHGEMLEAFVALVEAFDLLGADA